MAVGGRLARVGLGIDRRGPERHSPFPRSRSTTVHPSVPAVDLALILILIASLVATAVGSLLIAASAIRTIVGLRPAAGDTGQPRPARVRRIRRGVAGLLALILSSA